MYVLLQRRQQALCQTDCLEQGRDAGAVVFDFKLGNPPEAAKPTEREDGRLGVSNSPQLTGGQNAHGKRNPTFAAMARKKQCRQPLPRAVGARQTTKQCCCISMDRKHGRAYQQRNNEKAVVGCHLAALPVRCRATETEGTPGVLHLNHGPQPSIICPALGPKGEKKNGVVDAATVQPSQPDPRQQRLVGSIVF